MDNQGTSTRPYLLRALHDWCIDNGFTPYIAVHVDSTVQVPLEYVKNNEIVLNVGFEATSGLKLGNDFIEFKARFGGSAREIAVPVDHVVAIYARENGQGMAFPVPTDVGTGRGTAAEPGGTDGTVGTGTAAAGARGGLRLASTDSDSPAPTGAAPTPVPSAGGEASGQDDEPPEPGAPTPRPTLKRVK
jgi:stringent starvation protein B